MIESEPGVFTILSRIIMIVEKDFSTRINRQNAKVMVCSRNKVDWTRIQLIDEIIQEE